ncbi:MAG: MATE family efflux transporter [Erysipelotrichaceae bacterium]|nr:MATE family efflux transporter [Erysipelotrichaceae bacterium]
MNKGLMTSGSIWKHIIMFSIPLLFGNLFQLMYNTIDSIIVGQYVGKTALAAVGASTPLINLLISFFMGLSVGAGVISSRYYGGKKVSELTDTVHTFITFSFIFGIILSIIGVFMSETFMIWMKTPSDVLVEATDYLRIYFYGCIFVCLYNGATGLLQSVGDSKSPLYFLAISSVINTVLDLYFVKNLNMGVKGAAWATLIAQGVSCVLVLLKLMLTSQPYRLKISKLKMDKKILKDIVNIGIPAGVQGMIVSLSNVMVQSYINNFGSASIAGFSSALKFDNFLGLPVNSFSLAITTFSGQNLGAGLYKRVKEGIKITIILSVVTVIILGIIVFIYAKECISIFSNDPEVIKTGASVIRIMVPFYTSLCFHQTYSGTIRAAGKSIPPMVISVFSFVVVRQIMLAIFMPLVLDIRLIAFSYSITWSIAMFITLLYFKRNNILEQN